jgi:hypothetical protein
VSIRYLDLASLLSCRFVEISQLNLAARVVSSLVSHGLATVDDIVQYNPRELLDLEGFGPRSLTLLETSLEEAGFQLASDPYASYECAREGRPRGDASIVTLFLCESCASGWREEPFAGTEPAYVGESVSGYCMNCNLDRDDIHVFQWFLCGNCERVARSIGRSVVAAKALMESWNTQVSEQLPNLVLQDVDTPRLLRRTPEAILAKRASIDFVAVDAEGPVLGIEMKTGKNYIGRRGIGSPIGQFQLDASDCDDICEVVAREQIPVYLVHVQVIDRAAPPTVRYAPLGRWWTDLFSMEQSFDRVQKRPRETRMAAYYDTGMFRDFSEFAAHLRDGGLDTVRARLTQTGWSAELYRA